MARDDFAKPIIRELRERVANHCSNPDCRRKTTGPNSGGRGTIVLGEAAHIHAAAQGGPRYDADMSPAERASIDNAIWLCRGCARRVDRDEAAYPATLLRQWKTRAEDLASDELDTRPPAHGDAQEQLVGALTGHTKRLLPSLIKNAHAASVEALELLDPRFHIESSHQGGVTRFRIEALETVPFRLSVPEERMAEWQRGVDAAMQAGTPFEIDAAGFTVQGSTLLTHVFDGDDELEERKLTFTPHAMPARLKWSALTEATAVRRGFDDVTGSLAMGTSQWTFRGEVWDGLAVLTIQMRHVAPPWNGNFSLRFDVDRWVGRNIRTLPYLDAVIDFCLRTTPEEILDVELHVDGRRRAAMSSPFGTVVPANPQQNALLSYLGRAAEITRRLGVNVAMPKHAKVSQEDAEALGRVYDVAVAPDRMTAADLACNPACTLTATDHGANISQLEGETEAITIRVPADLPSELRIFGQTVAVPPVHTTLHGLRPRIIDERTVFHSGDAVKVEFEPTKDFWMAYEWPLGDTSLHN